MTDSRLSGDVCIVTHAGRDLGSSIARRLAAEGARVVVVDADEGRGRDTEEAINARDVPGEAKFVRADLTDEAAVNGIVHAVTDEWGGVDGLVNTSVATAGEPDLDTDESAFSADESVLELSEQAWNRAVAVTLKSAFFCTKHAAQIMAESDGGAVVNVAAGSPHRGVPEAVAACTTAGGLRSFTRQTAGDLAAHDVRMNMVYGSADERSSARADRVVDADDYAAAVASLLSADAAFPTGVDLPVDGSRLASF
jgi:NAD(P)-dependent dehydrogenase (short-subunit alcohol dehydrogenase family)